jgi:hypothetical protein
MKIQLENTIQKCNMAGYFSSSYTEECKDIYLQTLSTQ